MLLPPGHPPINLLVPKPVARWRHCSPAAVALCCANVAAPICQHGGGRILTESARQWSGVSNFSTMLKMRVVTLRYTRYGCSGGHGHHPGTGGSSRVSIVAGANTGTSSLSVLWVTTNEFLFHSGGLFSPPRGITEIIRQMATRDKMDAANNYYLDMGQQT